MEKTLLVLGASYSQIPLFKAAKRLGIKTLAATIPGPYQGMRYADEIVLCDITKPEEVYNAVKDFSIDGVTTCCMDVGTRTMGYLTERLSLPGPGIGAVAAVDKAIQKELYSKFGVRTAPYRIIHNEDELISACREIGFPIMIKAVDLMGSRGISRANTQEDAVRAFQIALELTGKEYVLAERFLDGEMFGVEAMISHGELVYVLPLGNDLHCGNPPFPQGHHVPWEKAQRLMEKIVLFTSQVCSALEFDDCALDMDCMLLDDEIWIIEATPRAGATAITETVSIYYNIDYYEAIVKCALGEKVADMFVKTDHEPNATWLLSSPKDGILEDIIIPDPLPDYVYDLSFNVNVGDEVKKMNSGRDRIGQLIVHGKSAHECRARIEKILEETIIRVR